MSAFNQLINGNGLVNFCWQVVLFSGNTDFEEIAFTPTYVEALAEKVKHPKRSNIVIELLWRSEFVGDETEMLKLQEKVNNVCILQ